MAPEARRPRWPRRAVDLLVVVGAGVLVVSALGLGWSYLRTGAARPTYVREAQFLAGVVVLLAWTVRNRRGRAPGGRGQDTAGRARDREATPRRVAASRRLLGGSPAAGEAPGTDVSLLALGLALLALSLGGEVLASG